MSSNYIEEKRLKESALEFFPEFFNRNLELDNCSLVRLKEKYLNYCIEYFEKYGPESTYERMMIKKAYDYIELSIKQEIAFKTETSPTQDVLHKYEALISEIGNYHFNPRRDTSYGGKQNTTNGQILLELSLFKPILTKTLTKIDKYLKSIWLQDVNEFYLELVERLENLNDGLNDARITLEQARTSYHSSWNDANRSFGLTTDYILGEEKKIWRKARNSACHTLMDYYREIQEINVALYYGSFNYMNPINKTDLETSEITRLYQYRMNELRNSPNYFCYIGEEEKQELSNQKVLRKEQSRKANFK